MKKYKAKIYLKENNFTVKEAKDLIEKSEVSGMSCVNKNQTIRSRKEELLSLLNMLKEDFNLKLNKTTVFIAINILRDFK